MVNQLRIYNDNNNNNNHTKYLLDLITNIFGQAVSQFWCRSQEVQSFCYFFLKIHLIDLTHGHITCTLQVKHKKARRKKGLFETYFSLPSFQKGFMYVISDRHEVKYHSQVSETFHAQFPVSVTPPHLRKKKKKKLGHK